MEKKKFKLMGETWEINFMDSIPSEDNKWVLGETIGGLHVININTNNPDGKKVSKRGIELTLIHEIIHAILISGQYLKENNKEHLVEWIAKCVYELKEQGIFNL